IDDILRFAGGPKSEKVLYIDDAGSFSQANPLFGRLVAERLYDAIAKSNIRVITAATRSDFISSIESDPRLSPIFEKIEIASDDDGVVGDKLSPDLRDLVNSGNPDQVVKVIFQAEDINKTSLRKILAENGVKI